MKTSPDYTEKPLTHLRKEYGLNSTLDASDLSENPIDQFRNWFENALKANLVEPNAMMLATVDFQGRPSARMVLLKGFNDNGFVFFTNYNSRKARELAENPYSAMTFWWDNLVQQIRIEGKCEKVSSQESDEYFDSRGVGSKIGALASNQSDVIQGRELIEGRFRELTKEFRDGVVPRPSHWGGYRLVPSAIEFWQGRENRLHDRFRYKRLTNHQWSIERLSP